MKFFEYDLYYTISKVYNFYELNKLKPRSADWFIYREKRGKLMRDVLDNLPKTIKKNSLVTTERVLKMWDDFGKNKEKYKTLIQIAEANGRNCCCNEHGHCSDVMTTTNNKIICKKHLSKTR